MHKLENGEIPNCLQVESDPASPKYLDVPTSYKIAEPSFELGCDAHLNSVPQAGIFHSAAWATVLRDTYAYRPLHFSATRNDEPFSFLPFMEVHSTLTGKRGVSLPFTDACEPIGFTRDNFSAALQHLNAYGRTNQWKYWEIRGGSDLLGNHPPSLTFYTHKLDLTPGEGNVFANFESSVRRAIRKAEKCDVQVEISQSEEAMRHFYSLQCKTRKKHGLPPQPFSFFLNICRHLLAKNLGFVAVAKFKDKPVSASVFLQMNGHAVYKFGASDERFQDLRGANLVMWRGIQHCIRSGARDLDFGRTSLGNEGLRRFKLGWGATEQQKSYFKYDLRRNQFVKDSDRASGWHNLVFSQMPIGLFRIVGSLLYRHLA